MVSQEFTAIAMTLYMRKYSKNPSNPMKLQRQNANCRFLFSNVSPYTRPAGFSRAWGSAGRRNCKINGEIKLWTESPKSLSCTSAELQLILPNLGVSFSYANNPHFAIFICILSHPWFVSRSNQH